MADHPVADQVIEDYLAAVAERMDGPRVTRREILDELRDGLHEATEAGIGAGASAQAAALAAVCEFGPPDVVAHAFAGELARARARRRVAGYLLTGPLVGAPWLLALAPGGSLADLGVPWDRIPSAPLVGLAVLLGGLVIAATGRAAHLLPLTSRQVVAGVIGLVALTVLADLTMLAASTSGGMPGPPEVAGLAIAASLCRLACCVRHGADSVRSRRDLAADGRG